MQTETISQSHPTLHMTQWLSGSFAAALVFALNAAWLPATAFADVAPHGPPNSIVVEKLPSPIDSGGVEFHSGQFVQYRVSYYNNDGNLATCNPASDGQPKANGQPQVLTINPKSNDAPGNQVVSKTWGSYIGGSSLVNVVMGSAHGAGSFEVSCGSSVKRILVSNDGEALSPTEATQNASEINVALTQTAQSTVVPTGDNAAPADQAASSQPPAEEGGMSTGEVIALAGLVGVATIGIVAAAVSASSTSNSTSGGGGGCSITFAQCCPNGSNSGQVCAPDRGGCSNSVNSCPSGTSGFACNGDPNGCGAFFSSGEVGCTC
jgi:hypothetical protein